MSPIEAVAIPRELRGKRVAVLVGGGIAAYKVADLISQLVAERCEVRVAMTPAATRFIGPATFHGLTGFPVQTDIWSQSGPAEPHVDLGDWAQVLLVAPATANLIGRVAGGLSDDLVTATVLAARCPVVVAPAMNDAMWAKGTVRENLARLRDLGFQIAGPESGRLASGHSGAGRLASAGALVEAMADALRARHDFAGRRVLVTAGGTREAIDPVRFISNRSSGRMGNAVAQAAADRGAEVVLVTTAPFAAHAGVRLREVESAEEMLTALREELDGADLLVMVAAVADFRPTRREALKIRREALTELRLDLERNVDILAELGRDSRAEGVFRIGFAAEDSDLEEHAKEKLARKRLDAIVANDISQAGVGMGAEDNAGVMFFRDGTRLELPRSNKREMADRILDAVRPRLPAR